MRTANLRTLSMKIFMASCINNPPSTSNW